MGNFMKFSDRFTFEIAALMWKYELNNLCGKKKKAWIRICSQKVNLIKF